MNVRTTTCLALVLQGCTWAFDYPTSESEASAPLCSDVVDNDYDGVTDCDDPDCDGHCAEEDAVRCTDGRDNDGDGLVDAADPRCWPDLEREVTRCASSASAVFEERFDGTLSGARWTTFGAVAGKPLVESQRPVGRDVRFDRVLGAPSVAVPVTGGMVSTNVFDRSWEDLELSFSARLDEGGFLQVALVPASLASGGTPIQGIEDVSLVLTFDGRVDRTIALTTQSGGAQAPWESGAWRSVRLAVARDQVRVEVDGVAVLEAPLQKTFPARVLINTEARFSQSGLGAAQIDDLELVVPGSEPCGVASPQIPLGSDCRSDPAKLELDVGHTVAVATRPGTGHCALVTASKDGEPAGVQSWISEDGDRWDLGAELAMSWGGTLTGAGVAWDERTGRYRGVVGVREGHGVRLMGMASTDCATWDAPSELARLPADAEAPSYLIPGTAAAYEVYVTRPSSESRALWRLRSSDASTFAMDDAPVVVFEPTHYVNAPVALSGMGPGDVLAVHRVGTSAGVRGLGMLVATRDDLTDWRAVAPWPLLEPNAGQGGFDEDALMSGAIADRGDGAVLLYAGRGQPRADGSDTTHLTVGTARVTASAVAEQTVPPTSDVCGDGVCAEDETCERCSIDCDVCDGQLEFAESFSTLDGWDLVAPDTDEGTVPGYGVAERLRLDPFEPGWLTHALPDAIGDFELSFDVHVVPPSPETSPRCLAYLGVGQEPSLQGMDPRGVFLRLDQSLPCSGGAPSFSPLVRTGEAKRTSSLTIDGSTCRGAVIGVGDAWHHVAIERQHGFVSVRVWGPEGCELASDEARVRYLGALEGLDSLLIGYGPRFGEDGWSTECEDATGAISVDNLVLRELPCPEGTRTCEGPSGTTSCVDLSRNPEHCGACFNAVGPAEICEGGAPTCAGATCENPITGVQECADLSESVDHCGACGVVLTEHEVCRDGLRRAKMKLVPPGYWIDVTEVTRAQYGAWLDTNPVLAGRHPGCEGWKVTFEPACGWPPGDRGNYPVRCVDWCDAYAYCQDVGKHLCGRIGGGPLQSGAEEDNAAYDQWYRVCTGGGLYDFAYGNVEDPEACPVGPVAEAATHPKCQSIVSEFAGVYDQCGSAREWSWTCQGETKDHRCRHRGGSDCESDAWFPRSHAIDQSGFRCCAL